MRTLEYLMLTVVVSLGVWYGAHYVGNAIAASLNASAALVADPSFAR